MVGCGYGVVGNELLRSPETKWEDANSDSPESGRNGILGSQSGSIRLNFVQFVFCLESTSTFYSKVNFSLLD